MKTVYYVIGPSASGKTTTAMRLAKSMGVPCIHADSIYDWLHEKFRLPFSADRLCDLDVQARLENVRWGEFPNLGSAKLAAFKTILPKDGDFLVEGFTLSRKEERAIMQECIGPHRSVLLRIDLPYPVWRRLHTQKFGSAPEEAVYNRLRSFFAPFPSDVVYIFNDLELVNVHYSEYQKSDFIAKKIDALKLEVQKNDVVNDVGCNEGAIGRWCIDSGASVVHGYDSNWRFLDKAVQKGLMPHLGNVEKDPFEAADITLCVSVFHYFRNPQDFLIKAKAATRRLFVLELPVIDQPGLFSRFEPHNRHYQHSRGLIEFWLKEQFSKVENVGVSVPPDNSFRPVYHCSPK